MIDRLNAALEGRYRIERELGEGGMARVYLAEDLKHHRKVAVKVLRPELAAVVGAERFLTEIETTANLEDPHILPLYDSGEADSFLFYVMPYVKGDSLRDRLDGEHQLPVAEAVGIATKVAGALEYAHQKGVVHRDVKPANILLRRGEPLVADFGIALAVSQAGGGRVTETGLSLGTPHYMSPEQATGDRNVGPRSDVYALGCVLYEMLAGEPPFAAPTSQAVLARILTQEPRRVTELRRTVPSHVDAALAKSLEKLPADRFESAEAFAAALEDPSFEYRPVIRGEEATSTARFDSPRPGWVAVAALIAVAIVGAAFAAGRGTGPEPDQTVTRFPVNVPEDVYHSSVCCGPAQALSPDGEWLVFVGESPAGQYLYRRQLGALEAEDIRGTRGRASPSSRPAGAGSASTRTGGCGRSR